MLNTIIFTLKKVKNSNVYVFYSYLFLSIFYSILSFGTTLIFKEIVDTASGAKTFLQLSLIGILVFQVCFNIFSGAINGFKEYLMPLIKRNVSLLFLGELVDLTSKLDVASLEDPKTVGIISRAYNRIHFQFEYFFKSIVQLLTSTIEISLALAIFMTYSPIGAIVLLIANIISMTVKAKLGGSNFNIYKADYETRLKFGYATDLLNQRETLLELKLFQNFKYLKTKILGIFDIFITKEIKHEKRNQIYSTIVEILPIIAAFFLALIFARQLQANTITVGTFVFLFTNMLIFSGGLGRLTSNMVNIANESNSIKDILEFYELKPLMNNTIELTKIQLKDLKNKLKNPNIEFKNVSFRYPNSENYAVKNISLNIPYSQNIAIIGENGAGKTTLIKLLLRVYDPTEGEITINGINIKEIPTNLLYKSFGTLFQNFGKFNLTVRENLELAAKRKMTDEEMIQCLKYSNAWKFIEKTKGQLEQQLGPQYTNGVDLSGGQWQSLAIARTYAKQAPIVILDEPTSAIDVKSEMEIFDRLNKKMKSETLIFISHRFSTIKDAEKIVVLSKGRIAEEGNHETLMKLKGKYSKLFKIQINRLQR